MDKLITLEEAKLQCRIDFDYEDSLLQTYIHAALNACQKHIGKSFGCGLEFTDDIKVGCLMYIAFLYGNRELVTHETLSEVPFAVSSLWNVYRDPAIY